MLMNVVEYVLDGIADAENKSVAKNKCNGPLRGVY